MLVASQAEMRKGDHVCQKFKEVEGNLVVISDMLKMNILIHTGVSFANKIFQYNTIVPNGKRFQGFHSWYPLWGLRVNGWLAR